MASALALPPLPTDLSRGIDEIRLTASVLRRVGPQLTEKQAGEMADRLVRAADDIERLARTAPTSRSGGMHSPVPTAPSTAARTTTAGGGYHFVPSPPAHLSTPGVPALPRVGLSPKAPPLSRPGTTTTHQHLQPSSAGRASKSRPSPLMTSSKSARGDREGSVAAPPATTAATSAVVRVSARTFQSTEALHGTAGGERNTTTTPAAQKLLERQEMEAAVGAAVFCAMEATVESLSAQGGALFVPVADEMVSVATVLPKLSTYPPPLLKHSVAGSITGSVLSSGVMLHQTKPGLDDNNRRVPSQLLVPIVARDGARIGVLQIVGKYRGAAEFNPHDEVFAAQCAALLAQLMTRYPVRWAGPLYDPVALHKTAPMHPATVSKDIYNTIPESMRAHHTTGLVQRTGGTVPLSKRSALTDDANALGVGSTLREVDCYIDNLQECWRRSVQLTIEQGASEQQRLQQLRSMREELRLSKDESRRLADKLRLEKLDVSDYRSEYGTLREELGKFLERKHAFDDG